MNVEDLPEYAKVPEVAKVLGLSEASVWRLVWAGELPSIRFSAMTHATMPTFASRSRTSASA